MKMLFPAGLTEVDIPAGFADLMNELSKKRGYAAHKSADGKLQKTPHPHAEYDRVQKILKGLKVIDERLEAIRYT